MCKPNYRVARIVLSIAISGLFITVDSAQSRPDRKKSQVAYQQGQLADQAGKRDEAIAAYTEAIDADGGNSAALRARAKDYFAAGNPDKARGGPGDRRQSAAGRRAGLLRAWTILARTWPGRAGGAGLYDGHRAQAGAHGNLLRSRSILFNTEALRQSDR